MDVARSDIVQSIAGRDKGKLFFVLDVEGEYLLLADFGSYCQAEKAMAAAYTDRDRWNCMSLHNIARSGIFAADRSVKEYADNIWHVSHR